MSDQSYNPNSIDAVLSRIESKLNKHVDDTATYRKHLDDKIAATDAEAKRINEEFVSFRNRAIGFATLVGGASGHVGGWLSKFITGNGGN